MPHEKVRAVDATIAVEVPGRSRDGDQAQFVPANGVLTRRAEPARIEGTTNALDLDTTQLQRVLRSLEG